MASGSAFSNVLKAKEDLQKSAEQLEQEKTISTCTTCTTITT